VRRPDGDPEKVEMSNPLLDLQSRGQSVWYDTISRGMITSGELQRLIAADGVHGVTSNPAIFEKAIAGSSDYKGALGHLAGSGRSPVEIYETIAVEDIQWGADLLLPVFEETGGRDGFISLEVSPHLARDTQASIDEALRLAAAVGRPNLMIKVPGTPEGVPAVEHLIGEGLNINITLLFSRRNYVEVVEAYMAGLEKLISRGGDPGAVASVASFFVSRIDTMVDGLIEKRMEGASASEGGELRSLLGKAAVANAKLAYRRYGELFAEGRWRTLAAQGARPQRLLWASTSTKNPEYRDVMYVEELIGADTVNTMPEATLKAFRDHGEVRPSLEENLDEAQRIMDRIEELGISMREVTERLQVDAVRLFVEPFDKLLAAIESQSEAVPLRA
jgi:transaldolase/glucose-6-phosphate isomerase